MKDNPELENKLNLLLNYALEFECFEDDMSIFLKIIEDAKKLELQLKEEIKNKNIDNSIYISNEIINRYKEILDCIK